MSIMTSCLMPVQCFGNAKGSWLWLQSVLNSAQSGGRATNRHKKGESRERQAFPPRRNYYRQYKNTMRLSAGTELGHLASCYSATKCHLFMGLYYYQEKMGCSSLLPMEKIRVSGHLWASLILTHFCRVLIRFSQPFLLQLLNRGTSGA